MRPYVTSYQPLTNTAYVSKRGNDQSGRVGGNRPFLTIQAAIDACATAGAAEFNEFTVVVDSGTWDENVVAASYVHLTGNSYSSVIVRSNVGPVLTLPTGIFSCTGIDFYLIDPAITDQVVLGNSGVGGTHTLDVVELRAVVLRPGIYARLLETQSDLLFFSDSGLTHINSGTSDINTDHVILEHKNGIVFYSAVFYSGSYGPSGSPTITIFKIDTAQTVGFGSVVTTHINTNFGFDGNLTAYKFAQDSVVGYQRGLYTCQNTLIGAGQGTGVVVETINSGASVIEVLNSTNNVIGFSNSLLAKTNYAGNAINVNTCTLSSGMTYDDAVGTINLNVIQNSKFKSNTDIIDLNALIGNPTNQGLRAFLNIGFSAGWVSGGDITDNGDGTVDIEAGTGMIRDLNDEQADLFSFNWSAVTGISLTTGAETYIYVDYNGGSPIVTTTLNGQDVRDNENDKFELYEIYKEDATTLFVSDHRQRSKNIGGRLQQFLYSVFGVTRASAEGGLILGESGDANRYVTLSGGKVWTKLVLNNVAEINTNPVSGDTFTGYYRTGGGGWNKITGLTQWNYNQYDNNSGVLQAVPSNRYSYNDFWIDAEGNLVFLYPWNIYVAEASAADAPLPSSIPGALQVHSLYVGRIVFQGLTTPPTRVLSAFSVTLSTSAATLHSNLSGLGNDDHTQYFLSGGRSGGQTLRGGTNSGDDLTIDSTINVTKGTIYVQPFGLSYVLVVDSGKVGIRTTTPDGLLDATPDTIGTDAYTYPFPRVTTIQRNALTGMSIGAHVVDTTAKAVYVYDGTIWKVAYSF